MEPIATAIRRDRWMRTACILWALQYVLFGLRVLVTPDHLGVYPIFAEAARQWWDGSSMYMPHEGWSVYRYSPTFAIALLPFGLLPNQLGVALWNLLSMAVLFTALRTLVHRVFPWHWTPRQEGIFLSLTLLGVSRGLWSAQANALLLAFAIFGAAALTEQRWWKAGFFLSLAVYIKVWPIGLAMLLGARWWRPLAPRFLAAAVAIGSIPLLMRDWTWVLSEYRSLGHLLVTTSSVRWPGYRDFWTIWEQFGTPEWGTYTALRAATAAAAFGWCLWQSLRRQGLGGLGDRHLATATLGIWASWQLLMGPGTERLTYGLIAPFAAAAILLAVDAGRLLSLSIGAWVTLFVLGAGASERALLPYLSFAQAIQPAGVVLFLAWMFLWDWRYPHSADEPMAAVG